MKPAALLLSGIVLVAAAAVSVGQPTAAAGPTLPSALRVTELTVVPASDVDGAYRCSARIEDAASGEVLAEPLVVFRSGEQALMRAGVQVQGQSAEVLVTVSADASARSATVRVELVSGQTRTVVQSLGVRL